ncbi:unnamed protein product [Knipowitschia caucasica]
MKEMARSYFWWPGLDKQIEELAKSCLSCQNTRNSPPAAPLHPWDFPQAPWYRVSIDFAGPFEERMFLVAVDAHSKWPEVAIMKSTTSEKTVKELGEMFSRFGSPVQLVSDNGPQLVSKEMSDFLQANGVQQIKSAPYHPATNGLAERFVQTLKHALKASQGQGTLHQRLHEFLLKYRTSQHSTTRTSPASLMFNRELRTNLDLLQPPEVKDIVHANQRKQMRHRNIHAKDRAFTSGDSVLARNYQSKVKWAPATIIAQTGPVSYTVQTADGVWCRHVDQLLAAPTVTSELSADSDQTEGVVIPDQFYRPELSKPVRATVDVFSPGEVENQSAAFVPDTSPTNENVDVSVELRYLARERRPPTRLNL